MTVEQAGAEGGEEPGDFGGGPAFAEEVEDGEGVDDVADGAGFDQQDALGRGWEIDARHRGCFTRDIARKRLWGRKVCRARACGFANWMLRIEKSLIREAASGRNYFGNLSFTAATFLSKSSGLGGFSGKSLSVMSLSVASSFLLLPVATAS